MDAGRTESLFVDDSMIPRRLLALLDPLEHARVALISAPAGYHKSELVQTWTTRGDRDDRLVTAVIFRGQETFDTKELREHVQQSAAAGEPWYFLVDNHDSVQDRGFVHELLDMAEQYQHMRLILAGRTRPSVPITGLAMRGLLVDIDVSELALTREEVREVVSRHGEVEDDALDLLMETYQGWPMAIELISRHPLTWDSIPQLRHVIDGYLEEEVLDVVSAEDQEFLADLSPLAELTPAAAAHLTARSDAIAQLTRLAALGIPMRWTSANQIQLNPTLRDYLARRLAEQHPARAVQQSRRAAGWLQRQGSPEDAIRHAIASHDTEMVFQLMSKQMTANLADDPEGLQALMDQLEGELPDHFQLKIARVLVLGLNQPGTVPLSALRNLHQELPADATLQMKAQFYSVALMVLRQRQYHGADDIIAEVDAFVAAHANELAPVDDAMLMTEYGCLQGMRDELREAIETLERAVASAHLAGIRWCAEMAASMQAWLIVFRGGASQVRRIAEDALVSAERRDETKKQTVGMSRLALGGIALDLGDVAEAQRQWELYEAIPGRVLTCSQPFIAYFEACLRNARGDHQGALAILNEELHELEELPVWQQLLLLSAQLNTCLALNKLREAGAAVDRMRELDLHYDTTLLWVYDIRLMMARGDTQQAFAEVTRHLAESETLLANRPKHLLHLLMMHGIAASSLGRSEEALSSFQRAGVLAQRLGLEAPGARHTILASSLHQDRVELTPAEKKVVVALATDASLAEIAEELFISPNTLKTHLRRIYRKLGVSGRSAAVERMKVLGMPLEAS